MKKLVTMFLTMALILSSAIMPVSASSTDPELVSASGEIDMTKVEVVEISYEEMVAEIAELNEISVEEVMEHIPASNLRAADKYYTFYSNYHMVKAELPAFGTYGFRMKFYVKGSPIPVSGGFQILEVVDVSMDRGYNGKSKNFQGNILTKAENAFCIYYDVNGTFYNDGTTKVSGGLGVEAKVGELVKITFSVSGDYSTSKFGYFQNNFRVRTD